MSSALLHSESLYTRLMRFFSQIDGYTLLLLLGVTNYLLWVKLATVAVLFLSSFLRKNRRLSTPSAPFYFYLVLPLVGLIGAWITNSFYFEAYSYVLIYGWLQWAVSAAGFWLLYSRIVKGKRVSLENSLYVFVIINMVASLCWLGNTLWESGSWWPYAMTNSEKYGLSTGDYIRGIFGGSSVVNAACNSLLLLYFTQKRKWLLASAAMLCIWLCSSNLVFILALGVLVFQILTQKGYRLQLLPFTLLFLTGYVAVNFQNMPYLLRMSQGASVIDSNPHLPVLDTSIKVSVEATQRRGITTTEAVRAGIKASVEATKPVPELLSLHKERSIDLYATLKKTSSIPEQRSAVKALNQLSNIAFIASGSPPDTQVVRQVVKHIYHQPYYNLPAAYAGMPLKAFALIQTIKYIAYHPFLIPFGAGMGNASSKLAMKATGAGFHGRWPSEKIYVGSAFYAAHLQDLLYLFSQEASQHSIAHFPNNTYVQLLAEYGLSGLLLFLFLYVLYFAKCISSSPTKHWSILLLTGLLLATDYWLESISIVFVFEMLILLALPVPRERELHA